jgi:DNA-binding NarL/FixJ family response regulator
MPTSSDQIRVLCIVENDVLRIGMRHVLEATGITRLGDTPDVESGLVLASELEPHILVISEPTYLAGAQKIDEFRKQHADIKLLLLMDRVEHFWDYSDGTIEGLMLSQFPSYQLEAAVRSLASGYCWIGPVISRYLLKQDGQQRLRHAAKSKMDLSAFQGLSPREREVLALLTEGRSFQEMGEALQITPATAKLHVSNIIRKLGLRNRSEVVAYALKQ